MLRSIFLFIFAATAIPSFCQYTEQLKFTEVIELDTSFTKEVLYRNARTWFAEIFKSANDVLQIQDENSGELVGRVAFKYKPKNYIGSDPVKGWVYYNVRVLVKQGKCKYEFYNFVHQGTPSAFHPNGINVGLITIDEKAPDTFSGGKKWRNNTWIDLKDQIKDQIKDPITMLKQKLKEKSTW